MSSILDALRKLEQEKATREEVAAATPVRQLALEHEYDIDRDREPKSYTKAIVVSLVALLVLVSIGAGATAAVSIGMRRNEPIQQRVASTVPVTPPALASETNTTVQPVDVNHSPKETVAAEIKTETKPVKVVTAASKDTPARKSEPAPAKTKQEAAPIEKPATAPVAPKTTPVPEPAADAAKPAEDEIDKLPILSESVRVRLGLPTLKINIVGIPNNRNPRASALINMQKVFQGETIPGTSARLMTVDLRGVVLDVNGQRYFLPRR